MENLKIHKREINLNGFTLIDTIYSEIEINNIISIIENAEATNETFRRNKNLFAIRQFHKEIPETLSIIFNDKLKRIITELFGSDYFITKSIYFDKPEESNWFVAYHQDLTISVDRKTDIENFSNWTVKQNQFAVQPPLSILENNVTIRIHLDDTTHENGALKVINESHLKGFFRPETLDLEKETETICEIAKGGIMIMKPLILHASDRTINNQRRRVIHIEFSNLNLPMGLNWSEKTIISLN